MATKTQNNKHHLDHFGKYSCKHALYLTLNIRPWWLERKQQQQQNETNEMTRKTNFPK